VASRLRLGDGAVAFADTGAEVSSSACIATRLGPIGRGTGAAWMGFGGEQQVKRKRFCWVGARVGPGPPLEGSHFANPIFAELQWRRSLAGAAAQRTASSGGLIRATHAQPVVEVHSRFLCVVASPWSGARGLFQPKPWRRWRQTSPGSAPQRPLAALQLMRLQRTGPVHQKPPTTPWACARSRPLQPTPTGSAD